MGTNLDIIKGLLWKDPKATKGATTTNTKAKDAKKKKS
ncbi:hypothetical protein E2C01_040617 [Portunus trituberculatus]|uniref:Uncharacterized protein n=2 Tax=Portunus trituberculatus TaxID=210409 RepID=A0A5B7FNH0_PORTR|nr:hypothetical protein [Portunus trituberculatus]